MEFKPFPKIARLSRDVVVTEKIDGTNAQVYIVHKDEISSLTQIEGAVNIIDGYIIYAGSRTRWIKPGKETDNYGFAAWVRDNANELVKLGPGSHFGEWFGSGIQRGYGLKEKRFALFNTARWSDAGVRPKCCDVVPVLYSGIFDTREVETALESLRVKGSYMAPGFMRPEGVIIYHTASGTLYKKTLEKDQEPKSLAQREAA